MKISQLIFTATLAVPLLFGVQVANASENATYFAQAAADPVSVTLKVGGTYQLPKGYTYSVFPGDPDQMEATVSVDKNSVLKANATGKNLVIQLKNGNPTGNSWSVTVTKK
ncbi:hypothetical protein P4V43_20345 [Brevibacillus fortis]|uniref:hypothetical protein n=1 Tax=Brevibacillus fortis TaxID=2126352 RepID=UPI002E1C16BD|nr:hypothetical protein [Brevibacillus fortis]